MTAEKQSALQTIEDKRDLITGIADKIWEFAELSLQEFKSAAAYCEALEKEGFEVERGTCNIETAFAASYGHGRPYIGILAEYDALSGLSQEAGVLERKADPGRRKWSRMRTQSSGRRCVCGGTWRQSISGKK